MLIYLLFSCVMVLPLVVLGLKEDWQVIVAGNKAVFWLFFILYLFSFLPGIFYFKRVHLIDLKKMGYFKDR